MRNPFARGSVASACMHYGGMVVALEEDRSVVWSTGCSLPCVSLFKPWLFGSAPVLPVVSPGEERGREYWLAAEAFRRNLLGKKLPEEYYLRRDQIQNAWIARAERISNAEFEDFSRACLEEERIFMEHWEKYPFEEARCAAGFRNRWEKKNRAL